MTEGSNPSRTGRLSPIHQSGYAREMQELPHKRVSCLSSFADLKGKNPLRTSPNTPQERKTAYSLFFRIQTLCSPCGTSSLVYPFQSCPFSRRFNPVCFSEVKRKKKKIVRTHSLDLSLLSLPTCCWLALSHPPYLPPPVSFSLTQSLSSVILLKFSIYAPSPSNLSLSLHHSRDTCWMLNLPLWKDAGLF